jgi:hypothetical protein
MDFGSLLHAAQKNAREEKPEVIKFFFNFILFVDIFLVLAIRELGFLGVYSLVLLILPFPYVSFKKKSITSTVIVLHPSTYFFM